MYMKIFFNSHPGFGFGSGSLKTGVPHPIRIYTNASKNFKKILLKEKKK